MITINPVFSVLVPTDNAAILASGNPISALAPGQIGFFSYQTGLSIDGTVPAQNKNFYIVVGVDPGNTGSITDTIKSAGNKIEKKGLRAFTNKPYTAPQNKKIVVTVGNVACDREYGVKFEFRSELTYRNYGYSNPWKSFTTMSAICSDACVDCGAGDPNSVVLGLANEIALDPDQILTTRFLDPTDNSVISNLANWKVGFNGLTPPAAPTGTPSGTGGTVLAGTYKGIVTALNANGESLGSPESATVTTTGTTSSIAWDWADVTGATSYRLYVTPINGASGSEASYFTSSTSNVTQTTPTGTAGTVPTLANPPATNANANQTALLEITIAATPLFNYSQINLNYLDPRQVNAYLSFVEGFGLDTVQADTQALVYEDGSGYDLQQKEYIALGWQGSPYRVSELLGVATINKPYYTTITGTYQVFAISYENEGIGGGLKYKSSGLTYIAVPVANTTALNSINAILHRLIDDATGNDTTVNTAYPVATAYAVSFEG